MAGTSPARRHKVQRTIYLFALWFAARQSQSISCYEHTMPKTDRDLWSSFASAIKPRLDHDDDPALWQLAIDTILAFADADAEAYTGKDCIIAQIGRCSHWIRPHWKTRAGTAWPYGYGNIGNGFAFTSLPEFDWSIKWVREPHTNEWQLVSGQPTRRPLVHRIAIPARTSRHPQATVHTIWTPGSPNDPKHKLTVVYGFEKTHDDGWQLFADWDHTHR